MMLQACKKLDCVYSSSSNNTHQYTHLNFFLLDQYKTYFAKADTISMFPFASLRIELSRPMERGFLGLFLGAGGAGCLVGLREGLVGGLGGYLVGLGVRAGSVGIVGSRVGKVGIGSGTGSDGNGS